MSRAAKSNRERDCQQQHQQRQRGLDQKRGGKVEPLAMRVNTPEQIRVAEVSREPNVGESVQIRLRQQMPLRCPCNERLLQRVVQALSVVNNSSFAAHTMLGM